GEPQRLALEGEVVAGTRAAPQPRAWRSDDLHPEVVELEPARGGVVGHPVIEATAPAPASRPAVAVTSFRELARTRVRSCRSSSRNHSGGAPTGPGTAGALGPAHGNQHQRAGDARGALGVHGGRLATAAEGPTSATGPRGGRRAVESTRAHGGRRHHP